VHTPLVTEVMKSVIGLVSLWATPPQVKCIDDAIANVKEVAVGSDGDASLVVLRIDPARSRWVGECFKGAMPEARTTTMRGAVEAWDAHGVGALTADGLLLSGPKELVERGLRGGSSGASLASVTLAEGDYVAWSARVFDNASPITGSLGATETRFRISGEADVPSEALAAKIESELTPSALTQMLPTTSVKADEAAALARLANGFAVKREGRHVTIVFELREPPPQQARDLGVAAALAVYGVRRYISNAKQAEARNVLGQLAKDVVTDWEAERPDGKPRAKKKLVSYGAVPKTVPQGVKYQSSEADWKPWYPLRFSMTAPQYYQYEIKAAKDGESAEIIARGDLNGDGKTSQFKLLIKVDRSDNVLRVTPSILEIDPDE
jgi:type IV pilus assembly protein PilA